MMYAKLEREYQEHVTIGKLKIFYDERDSHQYNTPLASLATVELPWKLNQRRISCIPEGRYLCTPRKSAKHGNHFLVNGVRDRDLILFHIANYVSDLEGCIGVGMYNADIDQDGITDVVYSRRAMVDLLRHGGFYRLNAEKGFYLNITGINKEQNV